MEPYHVCNIFSDHENLSINIYSSITPRIKWEITELQYDEVVIPPKGEAKLQKIVPPPNKTCGLRDALDSTAGQLMQRCVLMPSECPSLSDGRQDRWRSLEEMLFGLRPPRPLPKPSSAERRTAAARGRVQVEHRRGDKSWEENTITAKRQGTAKAISFGQTCFYSVFLSSVTDFLRPPHLSWPLILRWLKKLHTSKTWR